MRNLLLEILDNQIIAAGFKPVDGGFMLPDHWDEAIKTEIEIRYPSAFTSTWKRRDAWQFYIAYCESLCQ